MSKITTGDFVKAVKKYYPIITIDMVRAWLEDGTLSYWRNPGKRQSWYFIRPEGLPRFLKQTLELSNADINSVLRDLGFRTSLDAYQ